MICLAKFSVFLHFSGKNRALISTSIDCLFEDEIGSITINLLEIYENILGSIVEEAYIQRGPDLLLLFANGKQLLVRNIHLNTESYTVDLNGKSYVV